MTVLLFTFWFGCLLLLLPPSPLWLGLPILCWMKVARASILVLLVILEFWKAFSFSPEYVILAVDLLYTAFVMLRHITSIPTSLRVYIINRCSILSNSFSASSKMIMWFFFLILHSVNVVYQNYEFWIILGARNKSHLITGFFFFNVLLNLV